MSDTNQITVRGRVGTDPDVLVTANGRQMTKFRLASTRSYLHTASGEWRDLETEWFTVKTWGSAGEAVCQSIHRGMPVIVQGVLSSEEWSSEERTHHTNVITTGTIAVDIKYGLVRFNKLARQAPPDAPTDGGDGEDEPADGEATGEQDPDSEGFDSATEADPWQKAAITV